MAKEEVSYPLEFPISKKLSARVGFRDDRVEIVLQTGIPLVGRVTLKLVPEDMPHVKKIVTEYDKWMSKPKFMRENGGAE